MLGSYDRIPWLFLPVDIMERIFAYLLRPHFSKTLRAHWCTKSRREEPLFLLSLCRTLGRNENHDSTYFTFPQMLHSALSAFRMRFIFE